MAPKTSRSKKAPKADSDIDAGDPPTDIDPYKVLGLAEQASQDEIKKAYRRAALKHHPDKAADDEKEEATKNFQNIAFAYAILSDERRRKRYDTTGSTAETLDIDDDDFDWLSFFRAQWTDVVTEDRIAEHKKQYETSGEQRKELLEAYTKYKGDMGKIYQVVIHSDVLQDDERFRLLIDEAIANGEVEPFKAYTEESEKSKQNRIKNAKRQIKEWEESRKKDAASNGTKKGKQQDAEADLAALIRGKQASRGASFLDQLEAKYSSGGKGKSKKRDEPPEEAFAATAARAKKTKSTK